MMERRVKSKDFMHSVERGKSGDSIKGLPMAILGQQTDRACHEHLNQVEVFTSFCRMSYHCKRA